MANWFLVLHQIPPKPAYFRAKVLRRLNQLGALAIKNSAYLLPANDETLEDLQWVRREIEADGGEGWLFAADTIAGLTDQAIMAAFRELRAPDYAELLTASQQLLDSLRSSVEAATAAPEWRRIVRRYQEIRRIDFFQAPGQQEMETIMKRIEPLIQPAKAASELNQPEPLAELTGRVWVTRSGVKIDRIASTWLIRRFIDPLARFRYVNPSDYQPAPAELRFDMFEGEFTHIGDHCTFEVLLERSQLVEPALQAIAEVVHDIDLKDRKYQRAEAAGIATLIEGLLLRFPDDAGRIEAGSAIFDALYEQLHSASDNVKSSK